LGWYVEGHTVDRISRTFPEAIQAAADFSYAGFSDWRLADVAEYLNAVDYNDWSNPYGGVNAPFVDPTIRNYGGMIRFGTYTKDNQQVWLKTNGSTITLNTSIDALYSTHLFLIRNHYI
jgi:hypothetical protein